MSNLLLGEKGEQTAVDYLTNIGYEILARRYRACTGEVDIIAQDGDTLVFIEVKARRTNKFGRPAEAVTYAKRTKITKTALCYLNQFHCTDSKCRFDIFEVFCSPNDGFKCNHIINAF